jgi:hypothetical protein
MILHIILLYIPYIKAYFDGYWQHYRTLQYKINLVL